MVYLAKNFFHPVFPSIYRQVFSHLFSHTGFRKFIYLRRAQYTVRKTDAKPQHLFIVPRTKNKKPRSFPRTNDVNDFLERLSDVHNQYNLNSEYLFPANTSLGVITNDSLYEFYRRTIKKLGLKKSGMIMGTHSFRRNIITDIVNATGNTELAALLCGNSERVVRNYYYIGYDAETALNALNKRNLNGKS